MTFKIRKRVEEGFLKAEAKYGIKIPRPSVRFDLTGTSAGQSFYAKNWLRFNLKLAIANEEDFLERTPDHEVAHHIQRHIYGYAGVKPHGKEWKKIMIEVFGTPPKRCHNYDVSTTARNTKPYQYNCNCAGKVHAMGSIRHRKVLRGAVFTCNSCRNELEFVSKESKAPAAAPKGGRFLREEEL